MVFRSAVSRSEVDLEAQVELLLSCSLGKQGGEEKAAQDPSKSLQWAPMPVTMHSNNVMSSTQAKLEMGEESH